MIPCSLFIFLAAYKAGAQNNSTPEAKPIKAEEALKPAAKNSTVADNKELAKPVVVLPLQQAATPSTVVTKEPVIPNPFDQKTLELRPNPYKGVEPKNMDRPKASTVTVLKNTDPIQLPVQPAPPVKEMKPKE